MDLSITTADLIQALIDATQRAEETGGALTSLELCEKLGWNDKKLKRCLHQLNTQGRLEVIQVRRQTLTGTWFPRPGYRLKSESNK